MSIVSNHSPSVIHNADHCPVEDWDDYGRYLAEQIAAGTAVVLARFEQLTKVLDATAERLAVNAADPMKPTADRRAWQWSADAYRDCAKMVRNVLTRCR